MEIEVEVGKPAAAIVMDVPGLQLWPTAAAHEMRLQCCQWPRVAIVRCGCPLMLELSLQAWRRKHVAGQESSQSSQERPIVGLERLRRSRGAAGPSALPCCGSSGGSFRGGVGPRKWLQGYHAGFQECLGVFGGKQSRRRKRALRRLLATAMLGSESFATWLKGGCFCNARTAVPGSYGGGGRDAPYERISLALGSWH